MWRYIFLTVQIYNCVTPISELSCELFEQLMFGFLSGNLVHHFYRKLSLHQTRSALWHLFFCKGCVHEQQAEVQILCRYILLLLLLPFCFFSGLGIGHLIHSAVFPLLFFPTHSHFVNQPLCNKDKLKYCCGPHIQSLLTQDFHFPSFICCWMWLIAGLGSWSLLTFSRRGTVVSTLSESLCKYNLHFISLLIDEWLII